MNSLWYTSGKRLLTSGKWNWEKDKLRAVLVGKEYEPDADAHEKYGDVTHEVEAVNYPVGGVVLEGLRCEENLSEIHLHAESITIKKTTLTASGMVIVHDKTGVLVVYLDGGTEPSTRADFLIDWGDEGLLFV